jgi:hypothetical protein
MINTYEMLWIGLKSDLVDTITHFFISGKDKKRLIYCLTEVLI